MIRRMATIPKAAADAGATYARLLDKLIAADRIADRVADERMFLLISRLGPGRRAAE